MAALLILLAVCVRFLSFLGDFCFAALARWCASERVLAVRLNGLLKLRPSAAWFSAKRNSRSLFNLVENSDYSFVLFFLIVFARFRLGSLWISEENALCPSSDKF